MGTGKETMWTFTRWAKEETPVYADHKYLYRISIANGALMGDPIDINDMVQEEGTYVPSSAISIAGAESNPVLIVSASKFVRNNGIDYPVSTYVLAIDLIGEDDEPELLWKVATPYTTGQYPIIVDGNERALVFATTWGKGVRVIAREQ